MLLGIAEKLFKVKGQGDSETDALLRRMHAFRPCGVEDYFLAFYFDAVRHTKLAFVTFLNAC